MALVAAIRQIVTAARRQVQHLEWALARLSPQAQLDNARQQVDGLVGRAERTWQHLVSLQRERLNSLTGRLATLNPQATLTRGYAIVLKGQTVVQQTGQVGQGDEILVQVSDGQFGATVSET
jgi:exodeoxyribonuclease VII large subunit